MQNSECIMQNCGRGLTSINTMLPHRIVSVHLKVTLQIIKSLPLSGRLLSFLLVGISFEVLNKHQTNIIGAKRPLILHSAFCILHSFHYQ